jgi:hypothetical protein
MPRGHRFTLGQQVPCLRVSRRRAAQNNRIKKTYRTIECLHRPILRGFGTVEAPTPAGAQSARGTAPEPRIR